VRAAVVVSGLAGLVLAAGALAGCAGSDGPAVPAVESSPSTAAPSAADGVATPQSSTPPASPVPSGAVNEDTGEVVGEHAVPVWDAAAKASAAHAASAAMTAFLRPELDYETWWADLEPLLTYEAAVGYSYTDPANVPASKVTGPAVVRDGDSAYLASVEVPTDAGTYTVVLVRADGDAPWLVERLNPPVAKG